jgi:hypothetical protein
MSVGQTNVGKVQPLRPGVPGTENLMTSTPHLTNLRNPPPVSATAGDRDWEEAVRRQRGQPAAKPSRSRFGRVIGLWLGCLVLGAGGCLLGAFMPYRHPVAVTISALWWGTYFGCFGAWSGALAGALAERAPASLFRGRGAGPAEGALRNPRQG